MKRTFLAKLHINGAYYLIGALLLLIGIPLYQLLILLPQGYGNALASAGKGTLSSYLLWLGNHPNQFLGYRALLFIAFALLVSLPFTLFRIIVAQEILGEDEEENEEVDEDEEREEVESTETQAEDGMPAMAWRGKGFAVIAAWSGLTSIVLYVCSTLASTIYLAIVSSTFFIHAIHTVTPTNSSFIVGLLSIITNTIGGGLLALSCLFFGAVIARRGLKLWPGVWVAFGYTALAVAALLSGSAVGVASAPTEGQAPLTTPAILFFALWVLWFGIMLVRLKPEV